MKKLIFIGLILGGTGLRSQVDFPCNDPISTNPANPVNNQQLSFPPSLQHFLNAFVWYGNNGVSTFYPIPYFNMGPVFSGQSSGFFFSPYSSLGMGSYFSYLHAGGVTGRDFYPEDGWELLSINLGYYPDGTILPAPGSALPEIPYILLYNKYKNIIRLFATTTAGLLNPNQSVRVVLRFNDFDRISATLNALGGEARSLDQVTEVLTTGSFVRHPDLSNPLTWFHADFPVAFDPCVCYFRSDLKVDFEFYNIATLELQGRLVGQTENLLDGNGNPLGSQSFLSSVIGEDVMNVGSAIYKRQTALIDDYIVKLEQIRIQNAQNQKYNKEIEQKILILEVFKKVLTNEALAQPLITSLITKGLGYLLGPGAVIKKGIG